LSIGTPAVSNLREALEIYTNLGDREMIGSSFAELADAFIWGGPLQDAAETRVAGSITLARTSAPTELRLLAALGQASAASAGHEAACAALREALEICVEAIRSKTRSQGAWRSVDSKYAFLPIEGSRRRWTS